MNDEQLLRAYAMQAKWMHHEGDVCVYMGSAIDAFHRGDFTTSWEYLFRAEEMNEKAQAAILEWRKA